MKRIIQIADKPTLDAIKKLVETISTAVESGGVEHAVELLENSGYGLEALKSMLANGTYGLNAIKAAISNSNTSAIKSIQRGTTTINSSTKAEKYSADITIATINPSKSIVLFYGSSAYEYSNGGCTYQPYVAALTANKLSVKTYGDKVVANRTLEFSWSIVEFN